MSAKKHTKNLAKPLHKQLPFWLIILSATAIIIVVIFLLNGGMWMKGAQLKSMQARAINEQAKMASYLRSKYDEDFSVEGPALTGSGLGAKGVWKTVAHPTNQRELNFDVSGLEDSDSFSDQYVAAIWSIEANQEFQKVFAEVYGNNVQSNASASVSLSGALVERATKVSPKYSESKSREDGFALLVNISTSKLPEDSLSEEAQRISTVIVGLRDKGIKNIHLDVRAELINNTIYTCTASQTKYGDVIPSDIMSCFIKKGAN